MVSNPLEDIMNGLADAFERDISNNITYKDFMSANKDSSLYDIFSVYDMAASEQYLTVSKIIKQKFGIKAMSNELYWFIREFPVYIDKMSDRIKREEGPVCCVDKAWQRSLNELKELIKKNVDNNTTENT